MTAPKRIVVVDDEPHIRLLLGQMLTAPDFEVHPFADPRDALMKLHDIAPDLIICDVMMPDMDGRTFLKVVKRSQDLRDVPFIFLSAVKEVDEVVQAYEVGADDFVDKPFHLARLMAKVRALLRLVERRRADALTGPVRGEGTLALLKFCEDNHLTGRLTVFATGQERWADFLGGEVMRAGGTPEDPDVDPLDALLALRSGTYRIEQRRLDRRAVDDALARTREERVAAPPPPAGDDDEGELQPPSLARRPPLERRRARPRAAGADRGREPAALHRHHHPGPRRAGAAQDRIGLAARAEAARGHDAGARADRAPARARGGHAARAGRRGALHPPRPAPRAWIRRCWPGRSPSSPSRCAITWARSWRWRCCAAPTRAAARAVPALRAFRVADDGRVQADGYAAHPGPAW